MMGWTRVEVARRESLEFLVWLSAGCRPASGSALERIAAGPTLTLRGGSSLTHSIQRGARLLSQALNGAATPPVRRFDPARPAKGRIHRFLRHFLSANRNVPYDAFRIAER